MQERIKTSSKISLPVHKAKWFLTTYKDQLSNEICNALELYIEKGSEAESMNSWVIEKIQNECAQGLITVLDNKSLGEDEFNVLGEQERRIYLSKLGNQYERILEYLTKTNEQVQNECWVTLYEETFNLNFPQEINLFLEKMQVEPGAVHAIMEGLVENYDAGGYQLSLKRDVHAYDTEEGSLVAQLDHYSAEPYEAYFPIRVGEELLGKLVAHSGKTLFELLEVDEKDIDFL